MPASKTDVVVTEPIEKATVNGKEVKASDLKKLTEKADDGSDLYMEVVSVVQTGRRFTLKDIDDKIAAYQAEIDRLTALKTKAGAL